MEPSPSRTYSSTSGQVGLWFLGVLGVLALGLSIVAVIMASDDGEATGDVVAPGGSTTATVSLTDFAISPVEIDVAEGASLTVTNDGAVPHNLAVKEVPALTTPDLAGGESATLSLGDLAPGTYTLICTVPGHEQAGMTAVLEVGGEGGGGGGQDSEPDWAALDAAMEESILRFPAETEGMGLQLLEPRVVDGVKVFDITTEIVPWEVEPGKLVDAWTYNGQVPGPWIDLEVGDRVRVELTNRLPMGTDIHWHGIPTPNDQDGVAPITQKLVGSGESFTYEFTAQRESVGMYHAHHHGQMQVINGMFGVLTVGDVDLPTGRTIGGISIPENLEVAHEIPMVLNDAGEIGLSLNGKGFPATAPIVANQGDWMVVHYYNEGLTAHPMHLHQFPQLVVARDGIPLDTPYWADTINVAPGERYSVLVNLDEPGTWVWHCHILTHVERDEGMFGMVTAIVVQ